MSEIDWSKAPEGTIGHGNIGISNFCVWFSDEWYEYVNSNHGGRYYFGDACVYREKDIVSCTPRPATPSWSGEGLPPVGVVCMANGYQVVIVAHHCNGIHAIYAESGVDGLLYYGEPNEFRPIRTQEQIAHDMREAAINEMSRDSNFIGLPNRILLGGLYDAGYRKQ